MGAESSKEEGAKGGLAVKDRVPRERSNSKSSGEPVEANLPDPLQLIEEPAANKLEWKANNYCSEPQPTQEQPAVKLERNAEESDRDTRPVASDISVERGEQKPLVELKIPNRSLSSGITSDWSLIEKRLLVLLDRTSDKQLLLSAIPDRYNLKFGETLDHKKLGHVKLMDLLSTFPSLSVQRRHPGGHMFLSRSSSAKNVEHSNKSSLYEQNASSSSANNVEHSNKNSIYEQNASDLAAAIEFLSMMQCDFPENQWPANVNAVNKLLDSSHVHHSPKLAAWVHRLRNDEGLKLKKLRKRLGLQFARMGCVDTVKSKYVWNVPKVKDILASSDAATYNTQESTDGSSRATVAAEPKNGVAGVVKLIETVEQLESLQCSSPFKRLDTIFREKKEVVAIDCEGVPKNLYLIQIGTLATTYVFDCVKLGEEIVCDFLRDLLLDDGVTKLFHDLHGDAAAFAQFDVKPLRGTFDTQLAMESVTGHLHMSFNRMLQALGLQQHASKVVMKGRMQNEQLFAQRPLPPDVLKYAVDDVRLLLNAHESLLALLGGSWDSIVRASDARALSAAVTGGERRICFDVLNSYALASFELLQQVRPDDMLMPTPLEVCNEAETMLTMLPKDLADAIQGRAHELSDVVLDKGRRPHAWVGNERLMLGDESRLVEVSEIDAIVGNLGGFGTDNRAGLERQLHRISAIRNRDSEIIGLTLRFGRHVSGNTAIISDLLFGDDTKSILFLGEPGSGKTTVVREVARLLADRSNVCIVDTSNEIAGDGDIPHPCVGFARRMMVPSLDMQSAVMIECVQNHTPEIMVIDEIGRPTEVEAARTCKNRGVRLIASAHGDLRKLIKNPKLRGLIGGVESVTLGDAQAKAQAKNRPRKLDGSIQKVKAERAGPPTFDVIVELKRGAHHEWRIVLDTADAVDRVLEGGAYQAQRRTRNPETGTVHLDLEMA